MSENKLDTDALATKEMLKMFENMESHDLEGLEDNLSDDLSEIALTPIEMTAEHDEIELAELGLPDISQSDSIDADIIEMPDDDLSLTDISPEAEKLKIPEIMPEEIMPEEIMPEEIMPEEIMPEEIMPEEIMPEEIMPEEIMPEEIMPAPITSATDTTSPITNHLNAVVENAVQALQDWLLLRQQSKETGPAQGLAQLDVLLDTVTHQQQHLAEQLNQAPKVDYAGMATALGVTLASPQALGWTADQWRIKAEAVAHKTDDIAAMNAKLRKQLEQF